MAFFRGNRNLKIDLYWELDLPCVSRLFLLSLIGEFYRLYYLQAGVTAEKEKTMFSAMLLYFESQL